MASEITSLFHRTIGDPMFQVMPSRNSITMKDWLSVCQSGLCRCWDGWSGRGLGFTPEAFERLLVLG
jgi:hypothetical protein